MMATRVVLTEEQVNSAVLLAQRRFAQFQRRGPYGEHSLQRHMTGALGEVAALDWAQSRFGTVQPHFRYSTLNRSQADLTVDGVGVEVKTWRARWWAEMGRSVAVRQLRAITDHARILLFCTVPDEPVEPAEVTIESWIALDDFLASAEPRLRNAYATLQVGEGRAGSLATFDAAEASARPAPVILEGSCGWGHRTLAGTCWTCVAPPDLKWVMASDGPRSRAFHRSPYADLVSAHQGDPPSAVYRMRLIGDVVDARWHCRACFMDGILAPADPPPTGL